MEDTNNILFSNISEKFTFSCYRKLVGENIPDGFKMFYPETFTGKIEFTGLLDIDTATFLSPPAIDYLVWPSINVLNNKYLLTKEQEETDEFKQMNIPNNKKLILDIPSTNEGILIVIGIVINNMIKDYLNSDNKYENIKEEIKRIKYVYIELKSMNFYDASQTYSHTMELNIEENSEDNK